MSTTFPRTRRSVRGYSVDEVESFLDEARQAYSAGAAGLSPLSARSIRTAAFGLQRGGYSTSHVDAALERLEDAFATRERERAFAAPGGDAAWYTQARSAAQALINRFDRNHGDRFARVGSLSQGYHPHDVDEFTDRLADYFQRGAAMSVDEVRTVVFRSSRGGYNETQVDLVLDIAIAVMLAVK